MLQSKDKEWLNGYKNKSYSYAVYERLTIDLDIHRTQVRGWKK